MTGIVGPTAVAPSAGNLLVGRGKIYGDDLNLVNGVYQRTGEYDFGNCTAFSIAAKAEVKEKFESMDANSQLYGRTAIKQTQTLKITGDEFSLLNLKNTTMGKVITQSVTGATVTGETLTTAVIPGCWYPTRFRNISAITVHDASSTKTVGTDYTIDPLSGRIYMVPVSQGGSIAAGDTITIDYTYGTYTYSTISGGAKSQINMFIRFKGAPVQGPTFEIEAFNVMFVPSGETGLIADDYGNWTLEGMCIAGSSPDPVNYPLYRVWQLA